MRTRSLFLLASLLWVCLGAPASAQWMTTHGPQGVTTGCFAGNGDSIFAGTRSGVYRFVGADTAWVAAGLAGKFIYALASTGANLFAGTEEGVFRSTDNGGNWVTGGLEGFWILSFASDNSALFAGTVDGIFLTTDGGAAWNRVGLANTFIYAFTADGDTLFAGTSRGVYISTNGGTMWTSRNSGLMDTVVTVLSSATSGLFAATQSLFVYRSTDQGASWVSSGSIGTQIVSLVAVHNSVFVGDRWDGVYFSGNCGATWVTMNSGLPLNVTGLAMIGPNLYAGTFAGVFRRPLFEFVSVPSRDSRSSTECELQQNYPNPFNPRTIIQFSVPVGTYGRTSLQVFDVLGRAVSTLANEVMKPGRYVRVFDGKGLASGVYYCRLQAGRFAQTKRLVLLK